MADLMTMIEKFGFPVCAAVWMTWYGWYMTRRYMAATEAYGLEQTKAAIELVKNNVALATLSVNSMTAIERNTKSNDNLSSKLVALSDTIAKVPTCEAKILAAKVQGHR